MEDVLDLVAVDHKPRRCCCYGVGDLPLGLFPRFIVRKYMYADVSLLAS
jgi:hypothetical protein